MKQLSDKISSFCFTALVVTIISAISPETLAQRTFDDRSPQVTVIQGLHFGTFSLSGPAGGTITINPDGGRTATGDITLLNLIPQARVAILEVNPARDRNAILTFSPTVSLAGKNGRVLHLQIGPTNLGENYVLLAPGRNANITVPIRIGGKLTVPGATQPGIYSGMFEVTFHQE